jgi:hypothetical protein
MGAIHFSIDPDLTKLLVDKLGISSFVETGTFKGDSLASVRHLFRELHSCELSPELHAAACERFREDPDVHCHLGSSGDLLKGLAARFKDRPVLYWLDAHWCSADHTAGAESQCPLLEELEALAPLHKDSVVWIDDARYFMAPPPAPLVSEGWPTFHLVHERLRALSPSDWHHVIFANDTILFFPSAIEAEIDGYLKANGADWLAITHASRAVLSEALRCKDLLEGELEEKKRQIEEYKTHAEEARKQVYECQETIEGFRRSRSWKATKWLRSIEKRLGKRR